MSRGLEYPASQTPTANHVPRARDNGKIDREWVDGLEAPTATPTPNGIPMAGADGKLDEGWLPEDDDDGEAGTHGILSDTHSDAESSAISQGDLMVTNGIPRWSRLPVGVNGTFVRSNGVAPSYQALAMGDMPFPEDFFDNLVVVNGRTVMTDGGEPVWAKFVSDPW